GPPARRRAPGVVSESDPGSRVQLLELKEHRQRLHRRRRLDDQHWRLHQLRETRVGICQRKKELFRLYGKVDQREVLKWQIYDSQFSRLDHITGTLDERFNPHSSALPSKSLPNHCTLVPGCIYSRLFMVQAE